jgi:hypothetical protein
MQMTSQILQHFSNRDSLISICKFITTLSKSKVYSNEVNFTQEMFYSILPLILQIRSNFQSEEIDPVELYEPHVAAQKSISFLILYYPDDSLNYFQTFINNSSLIEIILIFQTLLISYKIIEPLIDDAMKYSQLLSNLNPRIRFYSLLLFQEYMKKFDPSN